MSARTDGGRVGGFVVPLLIGAIAFLIVAGPGILLPSNVAWLATGDPLTHYLGWKIYRDGPFTFPLGLNPHYGLEFGNSIVFSDSLPLLAIPLKFVSGLLPDTFQYFGVWLFACYLLQAWFGWKLVGLASTDRWIRGLGALLLVFSPPMLLRLQGHNTLVGQFLILASLYLYFRPVDLRRTTHWTVLLSITGLVHFYLFVMVAAVWFASLLRAAFRTDALRLRRIDAVREAVVVLGVAALCCWQAGYFSAGGSVGSAGYGMFRLNVLSLVDSDGWSYLLRDLPSEPGDGEGFNFLGLGTLVLAAFCVPALFTRRGGFFDLLKKHAFLLAALAVLTLLALTNNVGIGSTTFQVPISTGMRNALSILRGAGRLFWPAFYTIVFAIIATCIARYDRRTAVGLLAIAAVVQVADTSGGWMPLGIRLKQSPSASLPSTLNDPFWAEAAKHYRNVRLSMPRNAHPSWDVFAKYAARSRLGTNAVYLARVDVRKERDAIAQADEQIATGRFEADSIYILDENRAVQTSLHLDRSTDLLATIDGYVVVAPGWKRCADCARLDLAGKEFAMQAPPTPIALQQRVVFSAPADQSAMTLQGWAPPIPSGLWSTGTKARLLLPLGEARPRSITVEAAAFVLAQHPNQIVEVRFKGSNAVTSVTLVQATENRFEVPVPSGLTDTTLDMEFTFPNAARPIDLKLNDDPRTLAFGLVALTLH